jgi:hypothetical protein
MVIEIHIARSPKKPPSVELLVEAIGGLVVREVSNGKPLRRSVTSARNDQTHDLDVLPQFIPQFFFVHRVAQVADDQAVVLALPHPNPETNVGPHPPPRRGGTACRLGFVVDDDLKH